MKTRLIRKKNLITSFEMLNMKIVNVACYKILAKSKHHAICSPTLADTVSCSAKAEMRKHEVSWKINNGM